MRRFPLLLLLLLVVPAPAEARTRCANRPGAITGNASFRVFHVGRTLYVCSQDGPQVRLGPWAAGSKVRADADSGTVGWSVPLVRGGVRSDRLWSATAAGKRTMKGALAVPATASAPEREARVQGLVLSGPATGWSTTAGDVAMSLPDGDDDPAGDEQKLTAKAGRLLAGSYPDADAATLAASLKLSSGDGDGDECASVTPYTLSFAPAGKALSVQWSDYVVSTSPGCR